MREAALIPAFLANEDAPAWPLRLAQQAFAAVLEEHRRKGRFRSAAVRTAARTALSALSPDDRGRLERWLILQLVTAGAGKPSKGLGSLAGVDAALANAVGSQLPRERASLGRADRPLTVAA